MEERGEEGKRTVLKSEKTTAISGRKMGFGDMFKRLRRRWIREEWNERGRAIMRGRKRERRE